jgi:putative flippase GtrA
MFFPAKMYKKVKMRSEFFRYFAVGGLGFVFDYLILFVLSTIWGVHYLTAASLAFLAGGVLVYFLSIRWVFPVRSLENKRVEFIVFFSIGIVGLVLNWLIMWLLTEVVGIHYLLSKVFSAALIFGINFILRKLILFRTPVGT